jgi:hypothetical protein
VVAVVLIAGGAVLALGGGGGGKSGPTYVQSTSVDLKPGATKVVSVSAPLPVPSDIPANVRDAVLKVLGTYIDKGIVAGLRKGKADDVGLAPAFDQGAIAALAGPDRAVLFDESLPKAVGKLAVTAVPVPLTALSTADGKILLVVAGIDLDIRAAAQQGTVIVKRTGTMTFALQITGDWRITAWKLHVDRGGPGVAAAPTTTGPASSTPTSSAKTAKT